MFALFDDAALVEDENLVGVADSRKTVSYDKAGPFLEKAIEGLLDELSWETSPTTRRRSFLAKLRMS